MGVNIYGQLGDGTTISRERPGLANFQGLNTDESITKISAGAIHTLVLTNKGRVLGVGGNHYGNLGIPQGSTTTQTSTLIEIDSSMLERGVTFVDIYAGIHTSYAITNTGKLYAFGDNYRNMVGRIYESDHSRYYTPVLVPIPDMVGGEKIISVETTIDHALALTSNGRVYSWGKANTYGQMGNGPTQGTNFYNPVIIVFPTLADNEKIVKVKVEENSSFAITNLGGVYAWGRNDNNQLGLNSFENKLYPVRWDDIYIVDTEYDIITFNHAYKVYVKIPNL